jgi:heat shock transcription factor 1
MKKKTSAPVPTSFLQKTFDMLSDESLKTIVSWNPEGTEFIIYSINEFSEKILPVYFKHSNFSSFIRQLNMYDFHKLRSNTQEHIYKHPLFLRGKPELLKEIHRKTSESSWPVIQKPSNLNKTNISPLINKLVQMHKKNNTYEGQINVLEEKVSTLTKQNKILADQLWENKDLIKKIEKALMFFARFFKHGSNDEISSNFPILDNILSITDIPYDFPYKKQKIIENYSVPQSPLSFLNFEEELQLPSNDKSETIPSYSHYSQLDSQSDMSFEVDKIDFLLDQ